MRFQKLKWQSFTLGAILSLATFATGCSSGSSSEDVLLDTIPQDLRGADTIYGSPFSVLITNDASNIAYGVNTSPHGWMILLPNKERVVHRDNYPPIISPDHDHIAYIIRPETNERKARIAVDGKLGPEFENVSNLVFSSDSSRIAYIALQAGKELVVVDGKFGPQFDSVSHLEFTPDSKNIVYVAELAEKKIVMIGDIHGPEFDEVRGLGIIQSGEVTYAARKDKEWVLIIGNKRGPNLPNYSHGPLLSPDGKRMIYIGTSSGKEFAVIDNEPSPLYDRILWWGFSPDSSKVAYQAIEKEKDVVVLDGNPGPKFNSILDPVFSPDSSKLVYIGDGKLVINGEPQHELGKYLSSPRFNFDGTRFAYESQINSDKCYVIDGQEGPRFKQVGQLTFSPNGKNVAYVAYVRTTDGTKGLVVVNGKEGPEVDEILTLRFSLDGTKLRYVTKQGYELWLKVISIR